MAKKIIYWGTCYTTVGPPTDDYLLWFFSDSQVLRANRAYPHKQELEAQGYTLIEVMLVENASQDWPRLEHNFTFNEGKKDSVSLSAKAEDGYYFKPSREISEKIIELLSKKKASVNEKITFKDSSVEGVYDFNIEGSPELKKLSRLIQNGKYRHKKSLKKRTRKL